MGDLFQLLLKAFTLPKPMTSFAGGRKKFLESEGFVVMQKRGDDAFDAGGYKGTEIVYREMVKLLEREEPEGLALADSYRNLAAALWHQGEIEDAKTYLSLSLALHTKKLGSDHPDVLHIRRELAGLCLELEKSTGFNPVMSSHNHNHSLAQSTVPDFLRGQTAKFTLFANNEMQTPIRP